MSSTGLVLNQPKECEALETLRAEIQQVADVAMMQRIGSKETKDAALEIGAQVKRMRKALDDRRRQITDPMNDTVKQVIAFAKRLDEPLDRAEAHIRSQAVAYANAIAEEQRKEQARLALEKQRAEEQRQAELRAAAAFAETPEETIQETQRVEDDAKARRADIAAQTREVKAQAVKGTTEVWCFEVVDRNAVPDEFWVIDESLLRNAVRVQRRREIPGLRIFAETKVRMGAY